MNIKMTIVFAALLAALTAITQEATTPTPAPAEAKPAPASPSAAETPASGPAASASAGAPAAEPTPAATDEIDLEEDDAALAATRPQIRSADKTGPVTLVDIDCDDATLADILRQFRKTTGANIISTDSTNLLRRVSTSLRHVPWLQALTAILNVQGFRLDERDDVYRVVEDKQVIPIVTKTFQLNHASAKELADLFNNSYAAKDKSGKIINPIANYFDGANVVVVTAPEKIISDCVSVVKAVDHAVAQIYIEARFAELSSDAMHKFGIDWSTLESWGVGTKDIQATSTWAEKPHSDLSISASGTLSVDDFRLALSAFEKDTGARIFSNPKVIVSNGKKAEIDMTTKFPNVELTSQRGDTSAGQTYTDFSAKIQEIPGEKEDLKNDKKGGLFAGNAFYHWGIELSVTPRISPDGLISVEIVPTISHLDTDVTEDGFFTINSDSAYSRYPILNYKTITTEFSMKSGSTAVIGGLSRTKEEDVDSGIPYLRDIPWIGPKLFGWKSRQKVQKEIIIFVTLGIANPESLPRDLGLPKNAILGREYVNGKRPEPGDNDGPTINSLRLDMRTIKEQDEDTASRAYAPAGHVSIRISNDKQASNQEKEL